MGTLRLTNAQWTTIQGLANRPVVDRVFARVGLGIPAPFTAAGLPAGEGDTIAHWVFDDGRLPGHWRVRIGAGPTLFFQQWDELFGGAQEREISFSALQAEQGTS